ncbi:MAG: ABC transporter ATP-binding protein [Granulosicoccus sp.]
MTTLTTESLVKRFGGILATDHVNLSVESGSLHALIGPNGAGKTTLIAQLAGQLQSDAGHVYLDSHDITKHSPSARVQSGLTRTFQITSVFPALSAMQNVAFAVQARQGHSFRFWQCVEHVASINEPALAALERVGLADRMHLPAQSLSHGERRQLEIAMALATEPQVLLLDEPMAGMGPDESRQMMQLLQQLKGDITMLLVEHDMDAVFSLADCLSVLVYGRIVASGEPEQVRREPEVIAAYLGSAA